MLLDIFLIVFGLPYMILKVLSEKGQKIAMEEEAHYCSKMEHELWERYGGGHLWRQSQIEKQVDEEGKFHTDYSVYPSKLIYPSERIRKYEELSEKEFGTKKFAKDMLLAREYGIISKNSIDRGYGDPIYLQWIFDNFKGGIDWDIFCVHWGHYRGEVDDRFYWLYSGLKKDRRHDKYDGKPAEVITAEQMRNGILLSFPRPDVPLKDQL